MLVWPGDSKVVIKTQSSVKTDGVALSLLSFGSHTGTHIDAPSHFLDKGGTVDKIALNKLIGSCHLFDLTSIKRKEILAEDLYPLPIKQGDRVLFKTGNFALLKKSTFPKDYISLSEKGADYLVDKGVLLVGTDFLGIEKRGSLGHPVHKRLLQAKVVIVEGLELSRVKEGRYHIICLPLRVGSDGAPARVLLIKK